MSEIPIKYTYEDKGADPGSKIYPITSTDAVFDKGGVKLTDRLDEIDNKVNTLIEPSTQEIILNNITDKEKHTFSYSGYKYLVLTAGFPNAGKSEQFIPMEALKVQKGFNIVLHNVMFDTSNYQGVMQIALSIENLNEGMIQVWMVEEYHGSGVNAAPYFNVYGLK